MISRKGIKQANSNFWRTMLVGMFVLVVILTVDTAAKKYPWLEEQLQLQTESYYD